MAPSALLRSVSLVRTDDGRRPGLGGVAITVERPIFFILVNLGSIFLCTGGIDDVVCGEGTEGLLVVGVILYAGIGVGVWFAGVFVGVDLVSGVGAIDASLLGLTVDGRSLVIRTGCTICLIFGEIKLYRLESCEYTPCLKLLADISVSALLRCNCKDMPELSRSVSALVLCDSKDMPELSRSVFALVLCNFKDMSELLSFLFSSCMPVVYL